MSYVILYDLDNWKEVTLLSSHAHLSSSNSNRNNDRSVYVLRVRPEETAAGVWLLGEGGRGVPNCPGSPAEGVLRGEMLLKEP